MFFVRAHVHRPGVTYRERGLLTAEGKTIKNKQEISDLLSALWLPKRLATIHCPGHHKGNSYETQDNRSAGHTVKDAALDTTNLLITMPDPVLPGIPDYSARDDKDFASLSKTCINNGWEVYFR